MTPISPLHPFLPIAALDAGRAAVLGNIKQALGLLAVSLSNPPNGALL